MKHIELHSWQHGHGFGQDLKRPGERRTIIVIVVTGIMMVVEIIAGILFGSMALLADGLHMASHTVALSINAFAYIYARHHAFDERYTFGTGKVNALGGFTGAVLLAIFVAVLGLIVNGASMFILDYKNISQQDRQNGPHEHGHHLDHNLKSAYLHVLADALTSFLAIFALLAAKYFGLIWMDPFMGIVGAVLVSRWSLGLARDTSGILLDKRGPEKIIIDIKKALKKAAAIKLRIYTCGLWGLTFMPLSLRLSHVIPSRRNTTNN